VGGSGAAWTVAATGDPDRGADDDEEEAVAERSVEVLDGVVFKEDLAFFFFLDLFEEDNEDALTTELLSRKTVGVGGAGGVGGSLTTCRLSVLPTPPLRRVKS